MNGEVSQVLIQDIIRDRTFQVRTKLNSGTIAGYATRFKAGGALGPVELADIDGRWVLLDGWHRLAALERLQRDTVEATVEAMTEREARWRAAIANTSHGLPLRKSEEVNVFKAYVRAGKHWKNKHNGVYKSYREIADDLNGMRSYSTIRRWMGKHFPRTYAAMGNEEQGQGKPDGPPVDEVLQEWDPVTVSCQNLLTLYLGAESEEGRESIKEDLRLLLEVMERPLAAAVESFDKLRAAPPGEDEEF